METILLVYNEDDFPEKLGKFLVEHGYNIAIVQDAECAEKAAEQCNPDVIVLDALLEKMNGFELCRVLKENPELQEIPIIMTSAIYISEDDIKHGIHLGTVTYKIFADRCVMKPVEPAEVLQQVAYLLGKEVEAPYIPQVLIIDDEKPICDLLKTTLEKKHYKITVAVTGKQGLALFAASPTDAVLLDYKLPDISGLDVLQAIREKTPDVAVILMTAYGDEDVAIHAIEEHVDGYLRKPFPIEIIVPLLTQTLERYRSMRERKRLVAHLRESNREIINKYELLEQANRRLRELDRLKTEFLANFGHELRTPLNSIIGFTELVLQGASGEINDTQHRQLTMVLDSANHLFKVLSDVIEIAMIDAHHIKLKKEPTNIETLIDVVIREFRHKIAQKNLMLVKKIEDVLPDCYCSSEKIKLILYNLIDNAVKFSSSGIITVTVRPLLVSKIMDDVLTRGCLPDETTPFIKPNQEGSIKDCLLISVQDQGIGISKEDFGILFDEFRQVDGSLTREYSGTGLGLAISKKLIELHGGNIWLNSQVGVGTTFFFTLPLQ